ncbi:MAG: hypothetical protein LBV18_07330 [Alistipes sp.]|jgi:hypothetical protein|nr:hypothetical protein [Alistipes sp.]
MKALRFLAILVAAAALSTSCASIVSRNSYPVYFESQPEGARVMIENRDGYVVFEGQTPVTVYLDSSAGYMRRAIYRVTYRHLDREPMTTYIDAQVNGWYFGNLLFGPYAWIGMLMIDPLSGAMYRIPERAPRIDIYGPDLPPMYGGATSATSAAGSGAVRVDSIEWSVGSEEVEVETPSPGRAVIRLESGEEVGAEPGRAAIRVESGSSAPATPAAATAPTPSESAPAGDGWIQLGE